MAKTAAPLPCFPSGPADMYINLHFSTRHLRALCVCVCACVCVRVSVSVCEAHGTSAVDYLRICTEVRPSGAHGIQHICLDQYLYVHTHIWLAIYTLTHIAIYMYTHASLPTYAHINCCGFGEKACLWVCVREWVCERESKRERKKENARTSEQAKEKCVRVTGASKDTLMPTCIKRHFDAP